MANNPSTLPGYNGQTAAPDANYTYGSARNDAAPGDLTGTPRIAAEVNDIMGFQQALLNKAAIIPSGAPDTAAVSQYLEAITKIIQGAHDRVNPATMAVWQADTSAEVGDVVVTKERTAGLGGGSTGDVIAGTGSANGIEIVAHDTLSLSLVIRLDAEIFINQLGPLPATDISPIVQRAQDIAKPNNILNFEGLDDDFYMWENTVVIRKPLIFRGSGNGKDIVVATPTYPDTLGIIVKDGVVALLAGSRTGITTGTETTFAYDSGKIVFDGLTMRPENPSTSPGTVAIQLNGGHNFEIKNCLLRYFDAAIDLTGAYGADVHNNMLISCDIGVMVDPDYVNGFGNPGGTNAGYETNDIRVHHNSFSGRGVASNSKHIFVHGFGHGISWWANSFEQANTGVEISGYTGSNPDITTFNWFGAEESGINYYESLSRPVVIGSSASSSVFVFDVDVGGSNVNVNFTAPDTFFRPYVTVNNVWNFKFRSGSYFGIPALHTEYNEIHFQDSNMFPLRGTSDIKILWNYSGFPGVNALEKNSEHVISNDTVELNPYQVYIDPTDINAVDRFDVTGNGNLEYTAYRAGTAAIPFTDLTTLSDWLNKTPHGAFVRKNASELQINIANNTDATLSNVREIPAIKIVGTGDLYGGFFIENCSDVVFDGVAFANAGVDKFGQSRLVNTNAIANACTYRIDGNVALGSGSAWFQTTNSKLTFEGDNAASGTGTAFYMARLRQGSVVFTEPTLASAVSATIATIDAGEAASIVS